MKCKICNSPTNAIYKSTILNKYDIQYFHCSHCGFMQTEEPYWLEEAYSAAISVSDTGVMSRNLFFSKVTSIIISLLKKANGKFLDFGGGYGIFTRLMRDKGFDFYWMDKFAPNLVARGFDGDINNYHYDVITSFENFEHFAQPMDEIDNILKSADYLLFSTELLPDKVPAPNEWWYYCLEHGQHISFFSMRTLEYIAKKNDVYLTLNGSNIHILSKTKVNKNIWFKVKLILKFRLSSFFTMPPKMVSDMELMIKKMNDNR